MKERRKAVFTALNILLLLAGGILTLRYASIGGIERKAAASIGFTVLGFVNTVYALVFAPGERAFCAAMFLGLFFGMLGDILLGVNFFLGVGAFVLGHLMYFAAFAVRMRLQGKDMLCAAALFVFAALYLQLPVFRFADAAMEAACIAYGAIISCMLGKALANWRREKGPVNAVLAIGSALFYFSDMMLACGMFGNSAKVFDYLCLSTYYPGQLVLAAAVYISARAAE